MDTVLINTFAAKWTVAGWFVGLAYYNWFASAPPHLPIWVHAILVIGCSAPSILIGGGVALLMAGLTKILTGHVEGSPRAFAIGRAFISPILAFFAAGYVLQWAGKISN